MENCGVHKEVCVSEKQFHISKWQKIKKNKNLKWRWENIVIQKKLVKTVKQSKAYIKLPSLSVIYLDINPNEINSISRNQWYSAVVLKLFRGPRASVSKHFGRKATKSL